MKLDDYLRERKMTQAAFAKLVGIDRHQLNRMLRGTHEPRLDVALRVSKLTNGMVPPESWSKSK